jgi:hypothetical protein
MPLSTADVVEIQGLIARYCFAVDACDGEAFSGCFAETGRFLNGTELLAQGHEGRCAFVSTLGTKGQLRHITTSILPEGEADAGTSRAYCQVYASDAERGPYVLSQGVYHDRLSKKTGRWLFEERCYIADPIQWTSRDSLLQPGALRPV